ncbi:MAG: hypothetical protein Q9163_003493 [Psora crenata]
MARAWWKEAIYPSSFKDTNGDGWGDLKGIISKVDYLHDLVYKSPQADMGYDIADYKLIDPRYGTNGDVEILVAELGKRGMKLMMDLVVNHTSNEHPWFKESTSSKSNPKRDWYIWKDPRGKDENGDPLPPNNWSQILGDANSAWTYDPPTEQYYLSLFTPEQPDLNWENPAVREAVHDVMRFWLDKGACGYRMDVINLISKDQRFPDADVDPDTVLGLHSQGREGEDEGGGGGGGRIGGPIQYHPGSKWYVNGPRMHEFLRELKREVLDPYHAITVGEMPGVSDVDEILRTVRPGKEGELNMIFIFDLVDIDNVPGRGRMALPEKHWTVHDFVKPIDKWQRVMIERGGWNTVFLENHDNPRSVSRFCLFNNNNDNTDDDSVADSFRFPAAKLLALLLTTLCGTLFVYQGEEIGMKNIPKEWDASEYKDIESVNFWRKSLQLHRDGDEGALERAREVLHRKARDHARTPMQWDGSPHAGFCDEAARPWMRVMDDYRTVNADAQMKAAAGDMHDDDDDNGGGLSVWRFWQRGLAMRKKYADVFVYGGYRTVEDAEKGSVFAFVRTGEESGRWLTVLNLHGEHVDWTLPEDMQLHEWMAGNYVRGKPGKPTKGVIALKPWEGLLGKLL